MRRPSLRPRVRSRHPAWWVVAAFGAWITLGTLVLALPVSSADGRGVSLVTALFTASSAVCVVGLTVVDTATAWSFFGKAVLVVLVQVGGLGVMTLAGVVVLALNRRLGIAARRLTIAEAGAVDPGDLREILRGVVVVSVIVECIAALVLTVRFAVTYDMDLPTAVGHGVFHAVMAFNNAGMALYSDNMMQFASDWIVCGVVMGSVVIGGLGFPVILELLRRGSDGERRAQIGPPSRRLSLHTRLTLVVTAGLLAFGFVATLVFEWSNPRTLGALGPLDRLLGAAFHSVSTRTAGFNTVDIGQMRETSWLVGDLLMFIGSGSASTGGGLKVSTFGVLVMICVAEVRGERRVTAFGRSIPEAVQRQAVAVTLVSIAVTGAVITFILGASDALRLDQVMFEAVSAFGTVGLSTGITAGLPVVAQLALVPLMFFGRLGPLTLGYAFVARDRDRRYEFPEERPLVG